MVGKYKVITLCGSTRFKDQFLEAQKRLTLEGNIVISVGLFGHSGDDEVWTEGTKEMLFAGIRFSISGLSKRVDIFVGTGHSLALGGVLLIIPGLLLGGSLPVFTISGILSSCACLGETFYWKYLLSGGLAAAGIYIINKAEYPTTSMLERAYDAIETAESYLKNIIE